jgi:hypothetical protein
MARERQRSLRWVNHGLSLHYAGPFLFLAGMVLGMLGTILTLSARMYGWTKAADSGWFFFVVSGVFFLLAGAVGASAGFLALLGAGPSASRTLLPCVALSAAGCLALPLVILVPEFALAIYVGCLATLFGGWVFWMVYLRSLGLSLEREEAARGAVDTLFAGLRTAAFALPVLFLGGLLLAAMVYRPILLLLLPAGFIAALVTVVFILGNFESLLGMFFTPTGVPFALDYLNFIAGVRQVIRRRS